VEVVKAGQGGLDARHLLRLVEALLTRRAYKRLRRQNSASRAQEGKPPRRMTIPLARFPKFKE
jgi:hypothetical protein